MELFSSRAYLYLLMLDLEPKELQLKCAILSQMFAFFEVLQCEVFTIGRTRRIKRFHNSRVCEYSGEFTVPYFARFNNKHQITYRILPLVITTEKAVGLIKPLAARPLSSANLDSSYWSVAVRYALKYCFVMLYNCARGLYH